MLAERSWSTTSGCEHSEVMVGRLQQLRNSGSPLLVHIVTSTAYRLLLKKGKNAEPVVVIVKK